MSDFVQFNLLYASPPNEYPVSELTKFQNWNGYERWFLKLEWIRHSDVYEYEYGMKMDLFTGNI